jgi:hypothetical protein
MEETLIRNARAYASRHQLELTHRLGFGIHGIIFVAEDNSKGGRTAVKVHRAAEPFQRETAVYERLRGAGVSRILGFNVPQFIRLDDELRIIEMSIVARPFVLDFAGAWLDKPPDFPDEIWAEWEAEKRDQFEARWPEVQAVRARWRHWTFTWWMYRPATSRSSTERADASPSIVIATADLSRLRGLCKWTSSMDGRYRDQAVTDFADRFPHSSSPRRPLRF